MNRPLPTVLVVEDDNLLRPLLVRRLADNPAIGTVFQAATGADAKTAAGKHRPSAIVLDLGLPDGLGSDLIPAFRKTSPGSRIIVYSADPQGASEARRAGADGYAIKSGDLTELIRLLLTPVGPA